MAEFSKLIITDKGQALLAKMVVGSGNIEFTKISTSSAIYSENQLQGLTSLDDVKQTSLISKVTRTNEVAIKVEAAFTNSELTDGYYMRALGLYAIDPDVGEILYAATRETSGNCYMPAYNGVTLSGAYVQLVTTVGNAENVSLEVDPAAVATIGDIADLQEQIADLQAQIGYLDDDVYGVEADFTNRVFVRLAGAANRTPGAMFNGISMFGGRKRCNVTNSGKVVAYWHDENDPEYDGLFTTTGALTQAITISEGENAGTYPVGTPVQVMVEQPKFYYKVVPLVLEKTEKGNLIRKARYYVSETQKPGFKLHPAFIENGKVNDKIYLSAYEAGIYVASTGSIDTEGNVHEDADLANDILVSVSGACPLTQQTRAEFRSLAHNRGAGWELAYAATTSLTQLLMIIEYGAFNTQTAIGRGNVDSSGITQNTGASDALGNATGASAVPAEGSTETIIPFVSYRGEENVWGNVTTWMDGLNRLGGADGYNTIYIADHDFSDDNGDSPYVDCGIYPPNGNGMISAFGYSENFDYLFIPVEMNGDSELPVGDRFYCNAASGQWRVARYGGHRSGSAYAGGFYLYLNDTSSHRYSAIGGRLVYVPSKAITA